MNPVSCLWGGPVHVEPKRRDDRARPGYRLATRGGWQTSSADVVIEVASSL
jgi:hypothetical protein